MVLILQFWGSRFRMDEIITRKNRGGGWFVRVGKFERQPLANMQS